MKLSRLTFLVSTFFLLSFTSRTQTTDTTKYLDLEIFVTIWNGDTAVSASYVQQELDELNTAFFENNTGIQFVLCGPIKFINDPSGQLATGSGSAPYGNYEKRGAIHLWNVITLFGPAGLANPEQARIRLSGYEAIGSIVHEMGHILNLAHTHSAGELVNGSNCATSGDFVCDTPADPGLSGANVNSNCIYTGTATDANGDFYNPLTNNYMSYAPENCQNSFTQGQVERMTNYLNTTGFFINRVDSIRDITSIPAEYCSTDTGEYSFTPLTTGSLITGPGIVGNSFFPEVAGPGLHEILIEYPTDSLIYNDFATVSVGSTPVSTNIWNSFTVVNGGELQSVSCKMYVSTQTNLTMEIRAGSGVGGSLLHSQAITLNPTSGLVWNHIPINANLNLNTGQIYTIRFFSASSFNVGADLHIYPGANSNLPLVPAPYKNLYCMVVKLKGLEPCGNVGYRYVEVLTPINGTFNELKTEYCNTVSQYTELIGIPTNGIFYIDGIQDTILNAQELSIGSHVLEFASTDINGCSSTVTHNFTVTDLSASVIPTIDSAYCINSPLVNLTGEPSGGTMTIDGIPSTILNPSILGTGPHSIQYEYSSPFDTVTIQGPINPFEAPFVAYQLIQDSTYWQSFTSESSGYLKNIGLGGGGGSILAGTTFVTKIYKGIPSQNDLLFFDTTIVTVPNFYNAIIDSVTNVLIDADTLYSFSFRWIVPVAPPPALPPTITYSNFDTYPQGISSLDSLNPPGRDFQFSIELDQHYFCSDTYTKEFYIDACTVGINEIERPGDINVFPNPTSNKVTIAVDDNHINQPYYLIDVNQRILAFGILTEKQTSLDITNLPVGFYMVKIGSRVFEIVKM